MKHALLTLLAFVPGLAFGQTLIGHIPKKTVTDAHAEFNAWMQQGGTSGVSAHLRDCYLHGMDDQKATIRCILEDLAARNMDQGMRQMMIGMGMNDGGPSTPFLSDQAFEARMRIYALPIFGSYQAVRSYMGNAPNVVAEPDRK